MNGKKLSEMTLEELWRLFPIFLTEHQSCWGIWFQDEQRLLRETISLPVQIYHVGSTAVQGIWAKPIVDILIETENVEQVREVSLCLQKAGYILMQETPLRCSLNKGYTEQGFADRVFHFHVRSKGDIDEVYFKEYLNTHAEIAKAYEELKLSLWKQYEYDRDGYTNAKTEFVQKYTQIAKTDGAGTR